MSFHELKGHAGVPVKVWASLEPVESKAGLTRSRRLF